MYISYSRVCLRRDVRYIRGTLVALGYALKGMLDTFEIVCLRRALKYSRGTLVALGCAFEGMLDTL